MPSKIDSTYSNPIADEKVRFAQAPKSDVGLPKISAPVESRGNYGVDAGVANVNTSAGRSNYGLEGLAKGASDTSSLLAKMNVVLQDRQDKIDATNLMTQYNEQVNALPQNEMLAKASADVKTALAALQLNPVDRVARVNLLRAQTMETAAKAAILTEQHKVVERLQQAGMGNPYLQAPIASEVNRSVITMQQINQDHKEQLAGWQTFAKEEQTAREEYAKKLHEEEQRLGPQFRAANKDGNMEVIKRIQDQLLQFHINDPANMQLPEDKRLPAAAQATKDSMDHLINTPYSDIERDVANDKDKKSTKETDYQKKITDEETRLGPQYRAAIDSGKSAPVNEMQQRLFNLHYNNPTNASLSPDEKLKAAREATKASMEHLIDTSFSDIERQKVSEKGSDTNATADETIAFRNALIPVLKAAEIPIEGIDKLTYPQLVQLKTVATARAGQVGQVNTANQAQINRVTQLFDTDVQKLRERGQYADAVLDLLNSTDSEGNYNPVAQTASKASLARLSGEVGVLTEQDIQRFSGSQALSARLPQLLKNWGEGTLTEENRRYMEEYVQIAKKKIAASINTRALIHAERATQATGRDGKPIFSSTNEALQYINPGHPQAGSLEDYSTDRVNKINEAYGSGVLTPEDQKKKEEALKPESLEKAYTNDYLKPRGLLDPRKNITNKNESFTTKVDEVPTDPALTNTPREVKPGSTNKVTPPNNRYTTPAGIADPLQLQPTGSSSQRNFLPILEANKNKDFVKRILDPNQPSLKDPDREGVSMTHMMMNDDVYAFPSIVRDPETGELKRLSPQEASSYANKTGEFIQFDTPEEAAAFAEGGYKVGTPMDPNKQRSTGGPQTSNTSPYDLHIDNISKEYGVDPTTVRRMISAESNGDPNAKSPKGALGLMQLMPVTAQEMGVKDPYNPEENIRGGVGYLRKLLDRYKGDKRKALAAYNAGPETVDKHGGPPSYTEDYLKNVLGDDQSSTDTYDDGLSVLDQFLQQRKQTSNYGMA